VRGTGERERERRVTFEEQRERDDRRCASRPVYRSMYSESNLQHLGPRHEALSNLTWYESLLIARVHPVMSVITLTATGLLCYAGHVCNYYVKVLEWFRGLPAVLRDKKWFLIKRRRSINACSEERRQKKPTTANRRRLEAGIAEARRRLPRVYADSVDLPVELAKFPLDEELEMQDQAETQDLTGDVRVTREVFCEWLASGAEQRGRALVGATALMRYAVDQQGVDLRGDVSADTAWELCCRVLNRAADTEALRSNDIAQLLVYLLDDGQLPGTLREEMYMGMLSDLRERGKTVQTENDELLMKTRWVKQRVHQELDTAREMWFEESGHMPVDLDVDCAMVEGESPSITMEAEQEATKVIEHLRQQQADLAGVPCLEVPGPCAGREDAAEWHGAPVPHGCDEEEDEHQIDDGWDSEDEELQAGRGAAPWSVQRVTPIASYDERIKVLVDAGDFAGAAALKAAREAGHECASPEGAHSEMSGRREEVSTVDRGQSDRPSRRLGPDEKSRCEHGGGEGDDPSAGIADSNGPSPRDKALVANRSQADKPLVDPPEFGDRIKDTDKEPYWIPGAFPTIFQNETGDPYNYVHKEVDLITWGPHVLRAKGWHAQAHMTFMYWWMNMIQRIQALSAKKWYVRDNPQATGYTASDLASMSVRNLAKQMVGYTSNIPGTKASKAQLRKLILAMVRQIEIETRGVGGGGSDDSACLGDVPCFFGTLTSQRYLWDGLLRVLARVEGLDDYKSLSKSKRRELVNKYPLFVAWYCAVRLELVLKTVVVPHFGAHAYVAVFEWSPTGGMVHLHYVLWRSGAPRFDIRAEKLEMQAGALRKAGLVAGGTAECRIDDVVDFFAEYISEWNPNKSKDGVEATSHVAERINEAHEHTATWSAEDMLWLLEEENAAERLEYYKRAVRTEHLHDFHYPDPLGPPNPSQPCARLLKGTINMWYCGNGYPRELVPELDDQSIAQDALRKDLWRVHLCRNCQVMNGHVPTHTLAIQSNDDGTPVATKHQAEMYCCKYCSKHSKRLGQRSVLYDVLDDMSRKDAGAKEKYGDAAEESKLGTKLHRAFTAEIGEEMCQAEVAHHANRCPEYLCSRPEKHVHFYKKALALNTERKPRESLDDGESDRWHEDNDDAGDGSASARRKLHTKPSDLELYERRTMYTFPLDTCISPNLPWRATPEQQVAAASAYEFFRLVQFKGGKQPHLVWHEEDIMPIVTISPVIKLMEGPDFAFGARWALMQYHPWEDRRWFLDMSDVAVKDYFREWLQGPAYPLHEGEEGADASAESAGSDWHRRQEDYAGAAALQEQARLDAAAEAKHRQKQAIEAQIKKLVAQEDYTGAAALQEQARLDAAAEAKHGEKQDVEAQIKRRRA